MFNILPFEEFSAEEKAGFVDDYLSATAFLETAKTGNAFALVARKNGAWVGHVLLRKAADEVDVVTLFVTPTCRGEGVGKSLLHQALNTAKQQGASTAFLEVRASNVAAIGLYQACGFKKIGIRSNYYQNPTEDAVLYKLTGF